MGQFRFTKKLKINLLKIAILSNVNDPLYGYFISSLKKLNCSISAIVMDEKKYSEKDEDIFLSRTGGKLPNIGLSELKKELIPCYFIKIIIL